MDVRKNRLVLLGVVWMSFLLPAVLLASPDLPAGKPETSQGWMVWGEENWPTKPVHVGYFRRASRMYIGLMNPNHFPISAWDFPALLHIYDRLIVNDRNYKPTIPWLAESWEYLDPVTVLMKLRRGVKFHDGSAFNAEGVKYQMEWIGDKKNGAWTRGRLRPLKNVEVVDEYTVRFHFKEPWAAFLATMTLPPAFSISKKALIADSALREKKKLELE